MTDTRYQDGGITPFIKLPSNWQTDARPDVEYYSVENYQHFDLPGALEQTACETLKHDLSALNKSKRKKKNKKRGKRR